MLFCLNPACENPENPDQDTFCNSCGAPLAQSTKSYLFRERYLVTKKLGEGAFGRTYLAQDINFNHKPRVIKKLIATGTGSNLTKVKELFEREAQKLDELKHAQIPQVYDYFEENRCLYLVQEYIEGENLYSEWEKQGNFSEEKIKQALQDLLPVLVYLHQNKILHRDIKPENIMRRKSDGKLFLIDFGGAKQTNQTMQSAPGTRLYTPGYAAREHMSGHPKACSDIYSLGVTMVRLLTGGFPYYEENGYNDPLYDEHNGCWVWRNYAQNKRIKISPYLANILSDMIEDLPKNRYQSAIEVLKALNPPPLSATQQIDYTPINSVVNDSPSKTLSRSSFLKWLGFGGVGILGVVVAGLILNNWKNSSTSYSNGNRNNNDPKQKNKGIGEQTFNFETVTVNAYGNIIKRETKSAKYLTFEIDPDVVIDFVFIPSGKFWMGAPKSEQDSSEDEFPQHLVTLPAFYMAKYLITQPQYQVIMGNNPSYFQGSVSPGESRGDRPVEQVSWYDSKIFCDKLSQKIGKNIRLPTEAEWEYACRARTTTPFSFGETITTELVNYNGNEIYAYEPQGIYREETTPVGIFYPNSFGLYDMHGNLWEWCLDNYDYNYNKAPTDGSAWLSEDADYHVFRGSSWLRGPKYSRSAHRSADYPENSYYDLGFRVVMEL
jgi:formylglycine-generating enzyme required for sulfatase activity/tRNA A-37 threonylcarbamoyl transferase component Bud32